MGVFMELSGTLIGGEICPFSTLRGKTVSDTFYCLDVRNVGWG